MITLTLLTSALLSAPSGVDMATFAKALSDRTKTPALLCSPDFTQVIGDLTDMEIDSFLEPSKKLGFSFLRSDVAVGSKLGIPKAKWGVLNGLLEAPTASAAGKQVSIPADAIKNETVSFETKPNEYFTTQSISDLKLSKPVSMDAYFLTAKQSFPIAFVGKGVSELDFMRAVAKGLGGQFKNTSKTFNITFDPAYFRKEALKLVAKAQKGVDSGKTPSVGQGSFSPGEDFSNGNSQPPLSSSKELTKAALGLLTTVISEMPNELLEQTFAYPSTTTRINLGVFKNMQAPVANYIRAIESASNSGSSKGTQVIRGGRNAAAVRGLLNRINPNNPGSIVLQTNFKVSLELNTLNSANTVNLQIL